MNLLRPDDKNLGILTANPSVSQVRDASALPSTWHKYQPKHSCLFSFMWVCGAWLHCLVGRWTWRSCYSSPTRHNPLQPSSRASLCCPPCLVPAPPSDSPDKASIRPAVFLMHHPRRGHFWGRPHNQVPACHTQNSRPPSGDLCLPAISHASLGSWLSCPPEWLSHGCALCSALCHCLYRAKASSSVSEKIEALRGEPLPPPLTHSLPASAIGSQPTGPAPCGFSSPYSSCFSSFHASREPEPGSLSGSLSSVLWLHCFLTVLGRDQAPLCCRVTPPALPSAWSSLPLLSTCSSAWVPCLLRAFHPPDLKFSSPVFLSQPCWVPHCNLSYSEYFAWTPVYIIISFPIIL